MKAIFWKPKMLVCTLRGEGGGHMKKCTVCTLMKMLTLSVIIFGKNHSL